MRIVRLLPLFFGGMADADDWALWVTCSHCMLMSIFRLPDSVGGMADAYLLRVKLCRLALPGEQSVGE